MLLSKHAAGLGATRALFAMAWMFAAGCGGSDDNADLSLGSGGQGPGATSSSSPSSTSSAQGGGGGVGTAAGGAGGTSGNNGFPDYWNDGTACATDDDVQVWKYDDDTFILRQSLCTNFEGPFLYLLFGEQKVLLEDTGTGDANIAGPVATIIGDWLSSHGKASIELVVAHSHAHGDHHGGDLQFQDQPNTTVVGLSSGEVASFFGITMWPTQIATFDLGGRPLQILPIPGHQTAHIAIYDPAQQLLLTADTLYPGRLYVSDWAAYSASIPRLVDFAATQPVTWVLGTHIEMTTTPGDDYPMGATKHPNEHALQLTTATLDELGTAVTAMGANPTYEVHDDFIVYPLQ